jgi:predicted component of type VI protein secretion system
MSSFGRRVFLNSSRQIQLHRSRCSKFPFSFCRQFSYLPSRLYSSSPHSTPATRSTNISPDATSQGSGTSPPKEQPPTAAPQKPKQTMTERDAQLLEKMRDAMGGSDLSNVEMEDGVPDRGMKRNVRENMFRII